MSKTALCFLAACWAALAAAGQAAISPLPEKIAWTVPDVQAAQIPDRVQLSGMLGVRIQNNAENRLVALDVDRLLEGYRQRPGRQSWDGEHVGKWLHAATLAWVYTGDERLRRKLDSAVDELLKCQQADGYLGTYLPKDRWTEWDVWAHKYNLIGLITYMRYTGDEKPLDACRKMADLLCRDFGDGKRDIIQAGPHMGMAPTSVLEPMVWLYRFTGDPRYRDFCEYILRAWEQPDGPHIVSRLLAGQGVNKVGDSKAYEMLSCLNGALEWYRTTGDARLLQAALNAWQDITAKRLYLTGTASYHEVFHGDYDLPNTNNVGETCVTVTWLQFNAHLLRLTGQARFADELEKVVYNQLAGAQQPDGRAWGYYVQMEGKKPYSSNLYGHCCLSSGPRGIALIPTFAITTDNAGPVVNLYDAATAHLTLANGAAVNLAVETSFPREGHVRIKVAPEPEGTFTLKLRVPAWCAHLAPTINGGPAEAQRGTDGYLAIERNWKSGDEVEFQFDLQPRLVAGTHANAGKAAVLYGPLVLAADDSLLGTNSPGLARISLAGADSALLDFKAEPSPAPFKTWPGACIYHINALAWAGENGRGPASSRSIALVPFADAGQAGSNYKVWLPVHSAVAGGQ